ncbi:MAG: GHKL domain-containing protein [Clostridiales bacterium]|nr:GHKL domain-containing protein [Clostridiales bacterium]
MKKRFLNTAAAVGSAGLLTVLFCALFLAAGPLVGKAGPCPEAPPCFLPMTAAGSAGRTGRTAGTFPPAKRDVRMSAFMRTDAASEHGREKQATADSRGAAARRQQSERQPLIPLLTQNKGGEPAVYQAVSMPDSGNYSLFLLFGGLAAGVCIGLIIALIAARRLANRTAALRTLTQAVRSLEGDSEAAPLPGSALSVEREWPDELGELYGRFYAMAERLADARRSLARNNDRLAGILQGMDDGVIAADPTGNITLITDRAQELLGEDPAGREGNRAAVAALLETASAAGQPVRDTLFLAAPEERTLQVFAAPLPSAAGSVVGEREGALAVISDITRLTKLEELRSEFVANVTHELKTPLTSIRGYIELLKSGPRDEQTSRSFYEIIEIEAERLQKLTDDLLQLSEIENRRGDTENPPTPLSDSVCKAAETLRPEAESRGVRLYLFVDSDLAVRATPRRLYQLIKNLMENAVKYNRDGGAVNVSAHREKNLAVIRVHDTGIGIPSEHHERIFERFYRVDKGRSRELGGTGLGLSIVKHIVSLYGGSLQVDSEAGTGTTFTVRLPAETL